MNSKELAVYSMAIDKLLGHGLVKDAREVLQFAISQSPPQGSAVQSAAEENDAADDGGK